MIYTYTSRLFVLLLLFAFFSAPAQDRSEDLFLEQIQGLHARHKISALAIDEENHKYVGTEVGLYRVRAVSNVIDTIMEHEKILALTWHKRTGLWAGLENGRVRNTTTGEEIVLDVEGTRINCMTAGSNEIWIGTDKGVFTVSTTRMKQTDHFTPVNSKLGSEQINAIYWGPYNTIWIGTAAGVVRVFGDKWQVYEKDHSFTGITETHEGVWLASEDEMWLVYQRNRWAPVDAANGLVKGDLRTLTSDKKGNIYIASEMLVRFNPYTNKVDSVQIAREFLEADALAMLWDSNDELWLASSNQGLVTLRQKNTVEQLSAVLIIEKEPKCADGATGAISMEVAGGKPPYNYAWNQDDRSRRREEGLMAGDYEITVSDAAGSTYVLEATLEAPPPMKIHIESSYAPSSREARDGSAQIRIDGGTPPYKIEWDNGEDDLTADRLTGGLHKVTITDANRCEHVADVEIKQGKILAALDIEKINVGQTLRIERLYFQADSSRIERNSHEILDEIYAFLNENKKVVIEIGGHTNNIPDHDYCDKLSTARAVSVARYLYDKGIPENRIQARGYGKRNPVATNSTAEGRAKNQRVEIRILSLGNE